MNATAHKNFATNVLGVSGKIYSEMNDANDKRNAAIRAAREAYEAAEFGPAKDAAGISLDAVLAS